MKLLLARHGETEFNRQRKFYGSADVDLDEKGQEQARILAQKVLAVQPTVLVQTNLRRTQETLRPLTRELPAVPVITLPNLAEKGFGDWEGLDADEIEARYPDEWTKWLRAPLTYTPPTVEPFADFKDRVHEGLQWLLRHLTADDTALIVAHLGTIRLIYQELVAPEADFYSLDFKASCFSMVELQDGRVCQCLLNQ
jgi:alpha-ribazole phosphatase